MSFIPANYPVEFYVVGEATEDRFGNKVPGKGSWVPAMVAQWWVHRTGEKGDDSILRTIDSLTVHVPDDSPVTAVSKVRLPDMTVWEVAGNPEDYNQGWHGWSPELLVIHAERVEG